MADISKNSGVNNVSFVPTADPSQLQQIMQIQRQQQLAQQLTQNAEMPAPNDMAGNTVYRHSPLEFLARGASQALGGRANLKAQMMAMQLQGQQLSGLSGQGPSGAQGFGGYTTQQLAQARIAENFVPGGGKAYLDNIALTNNQKDAMAAHLKDPVALAGATTAAQEQNKISDRTVGGISGVPMTNQDAMARAQVMMGGQAQTPDQSQSLPLGGAAPPPAPVGQSALPPPNFAGGTSSPPGPPGSMGPSAIGNIPMPASGALPAPQGADPAINPAYASAVAPPQGAPAPAMGGIPPAPAIGNDPVRDQMLAAQASATKTGLDAGATNAAEAAKTLHIMQSNLPSALQRFQHMKDAAGDASYGIGVNEEGDGVKQQIYNNLAGNKTAKANSLLKQYAAQGILPELGPQLAQAGIKGNKFLEGIANSASGLDLTAPPDVKKSLVDGLQNTYINNLKSTAAQLRNQGQPAPSEADIDKMVMSTGALAKARSAIAQGAPRDAIMKRLMAVGIDPGGL